MQIIILGCVQKLQWCLLLFFAQIDCSPAEVIIVGSIPWTANPEHPHKHSQQNVYRPLKRLLGCTMWNYRPLEIWTENKWYSWNIYARESKIMNWHGTAPLNTCKAHHLELEIFKLKPRF